MIRLSLCTFPYSILRAINSPPNLSNILYHCEETLPLGIPSILGADRGYVHGDFGENPTGDLQALPSSTLRAPPPVRRVRNDGSSDRSENAPGASLQVSRSTIATVQRAAHTALPSSSSIITCHTWLLRPACTGVPTAVRLPPARLGLRWLALISEPKAPLPGGQFKKAPMLATDSARTTLTPPCR